MTSITPRSFTIPSISGISETTCAEHIKLYEGYVKNFNLLQEKLATYMKDPSTYAYEIGELSRRTSFEFNGIMNHEYYFEQLVDGPRPLDPASTLYQRIVSQWGSFDTWKASFTQLAMTRGIGWAIMYYDQIHDQLIHTWCDEQHLGHLGSATFIVGIDMWEHSYVYDYQPSGKGRYINDYIGAMNWDVIAARYSPRNH